MDTDDDRNAKPEDLHAQAIRHAGEAYAAERENIESARDAQRFYAGEQWNDAAKMAREREGRPTLTINRLTAFVRQVTGDVRKDTPSMRFLPAKDGATEKTAEVVTGLVRNIEQASNAKAAYVQAVENACQAGIGWIRVNTEYASEKDFDQDIRIRRVTDPLGVLCDPTAQEPDKSDSRFMLVFDDMAVEDFKRKYPEATVDDFPSPPTGGLVWKTEKTVRVAEYWFKKPVKKTLWLHADGTASEEKPPEEDAKSREVEGHEIWQAIISGREVIRKEQKWNGRYFPFAPVLGEEIRLDGRTIRKGMVHDSRDAQQAYNYARTAAVEATSAQPKMPYLLTANQIKGREDEWDKLGTTNPAYLVYNADPQINTPPQRVPPPPVQSGLDSQAMIAANELEAITGIYKSGLGAPSNETSGRAILARQREGDTGTYLYIDNLATALRRLGIILMDLIPKIYDTPRYVRVLKEDGTHDMAWVNQPEQVIDPETQQAIEKIEHDLSIGEYDVIVSTGPSFQTRRQEAAESARQMIQAYPELMKIAGDLMLKSLDMPYADEMAKRMERMIPPELKEDNPQPPQQQVDPLAAARAMKDAASTDKIRAETQTIELQNVQLAGQIATLSQVLPQILQFMQQATQQQGGQPQPAAPPMGEAPPPMPPMQISEPAPDMGDGLPPVVELTPQEAPA